MHPGYISVAEALATMDSGIGGSSKLCSPTKQAKLKRCYCSPEEGDGHELRGVTGIKVGVRDF